jgi:polysaccharide biosynthesis protein PslH
MSFEPILYITHRVPFPPDKGDRIRNYHLLRQLATKGPVWLAALADEPIPAETLATLHRLCLRVGTVPVQSKKRWLRAGLSLLKGRSLSEGLFYEPELATLLSTWSRETRFRAAVVSSSGVAPYLRRNGLEQVPAYVDLVDVDSQKWFDFAEASAVPKKWVYRLEGQRVRKLEKEVVQWAKLTTLVSPHEAEILDGYTHAGAATVAQNGVDQEFFQPQPSVVQQACAFVGAMDYLPNVDAACWFVAEVWPKVRKLHPEAQFWIIGRKPTNEVLKLGQQSGVIVVGQVPDVRPKVAEAAVVVVPMRLSRGLQNKVLEALAMGKAVIAAPPALAALKTEAGTHLLKAQSVEEWVEQIDALLKDPERRQQLGEGGLNYVRTHHHWDRCLRPLLDRIPSERET